MAIKSVLVRLRGESGDLDRALSSSARHAKVLDNNLKDADESGRGLSKALETSNDRTTMLIQSALALGPALVPLGAQAVPVVAGLATQLGFATVAAGVTALAFSGVGKALKAVNDYEVEPTTANFQKMQETLATLGPAGQDFVHFLQDLRPKMQELQDIAQAGMLPGVEDGIGAMFDRLPQFERIIDTISTTLGTLASDAGESLGGPQWDEFFSFIEREANPILTEFSKTAGNVLLGLANMTEALGPLSADFSSGFLDMSRDFVQWSSDLENSRGYQDFVNYIERTGPKVWDTLGALANALLQIVEAAAPVGEASLPVIKALADTIAAIADSPAGPVLIGLAAGFSAVSRAIALYQAANGNALLGFMKGSGEEGKRAGLGLRAAGAGVGILALSLTDLDEKAGLSNTAMLTLMGMMAGPWGAAIGGGVGLTLDLAKANNDLEAAVRAVDTAMATGTFSEQNQRIAELRTALRSAEGDVNDFKDLFRFSDSDGESYFQNLGGALSGLGIMLTGGTSEAGNKLAFLREEMKGTGDVADIMGGAIGLTGDQMRVAAGDAETLSGALARLQGWLDKRSAIRNYQSALDDLQDGLKKNARAWSANNEAGRANLDLVDKTVTGVLQMAQTFKDPGLRGKFLQGARSDLEGLAKQFPGARAQIQQTIKKLDDLGLTHPKPKVDLDKSRMDGKVNEAKGDLDRLDGKRPKPKADLDSTRAKRGINAVDSLLADLTGTTAHPKVIADTGQALSAILRVKGTLDAIRDKSVTVTVNQQTGHSMVEPHANIARASGGTIPGQRHPYGDKVLMWGAPGEEVITNRNGEADRFRADRAAGRIPRYASGGTVIGGIIYPKGYNTLDDKIAIAEAAKQVRDLTRELRDRVDKGKHKGEHVERGAERDLTILQLKAAQRDLAAAKAESRNRAMDNKLARSLNTLQAAADRASKSLEDETSKRDDLIALHDQMQSGIKSGLTSDLWAETDSALPSWLAGSQVKGPPDPLAALRKDIANSKEFYDLELQLAGRGLKGGAFEEAASNGGLAGLRTLSSYSDADLAQYASLYSQRESASNMAGGLGSFVVYGQQIAQQTKVVSDMAATNAAVAAQVNRMAAAIDAQNARSANAPKLIGEAVGKVLNGVFVAGYKAGQR